MRPLPFIVISASLVAGVLGAATAYSPRLAGYEASLVGTTLNADAGGGRPRTPPAVAEPPIARKNTVLTSEIIRQLLDAGVRRVRVKEFSLARWGEWWLFAVGVSGLLAGGVLARRDTAIAAAQAHSDSARGPGDPRELLAELSRGLDSVVEQLDIAGNEAAKRRIILDRVGDLQRGPQTRFPEARPALLRLGGLSGYATVMDTFAAAERQINRAWSAAADGYLDEARASLHTGRELLAETTKRLASLGSAT